MESHRQDEARTEDQRSGRLPGPRRARRESTRGARPARPPPPDLSASPARSPPCRHRAIRRRLPATAGSRWIRCTVPRADVKCSWPDAFGSVPLQTLGYLSWNFGTLLLNSKRPASRSVEQSSTSPDATPNLPATATGRRRTIANPYLLAAVLRPG